MTQDSIRLTHSSGKIRAEIPLSSSKSESNRALIIQALAGSGIELDNLAEARDTQTMIRLLKSEDNVLDVLDAGTTMRFLTAYCTATNRETILTGTPRMCDRPIKILVDALCELGAEISYQEKEGYPPLHIKGFQQSTDQVSVRGDVSSQYISALLMVAPTLPLGLTLTLTGTVSSRPYIEMTLQLMSHFGITYGWEENIITIPKQTYQANQYTIESDWSGASYWYSIAALAEEAEIKILRLKENSLQGDSALVELMRALGIQSEFDETGVTLKKIAAAKEFEYDFSHCPDLAQTIAVVCAAKGIKARLTGLHSLRIKETDRIAALQQELRKFGVELEVIGDEEIRVPGNKAQVNGQMVATYDDHRMGMAFAPLALLGEVVIEDPAVVNKSYPSFWKHLELAGFVQNS
ncbi:3-phosphoshikimate 1-carboxyvinyltransferase [Rapidithrix thailandica]|uniref:3-phosphoshikimate 1-carboxyvinyltransferase n=1 Tax=Rapidithrix thailandica TaxID=413964 RepID=A0AAW9S7C9_9BACT